MVAASIILLMAASAHASGLTVVTLGTSLTARGGWQAPLQRALEHCLGAGVTIQIVARVGAASDWGLEAVPTVLNAKPDVVLVEFASNDAALNRFMAPSRSGANVARIISALRKADPRTSVIVMAMSPVSGWRGAMRPLLNVYMDAHAEAARAAGASFVDFRPAWAALPDAERQAALSDGLHPAPDVAERIMVPELVRLIAPAGCAGPG